MPPGVQQPPPLQPQGRGIHPFEIFLQWFTGILLVAFCVYGITETCGDSLNETLKQIIISITSKVFVFCIVIYFGLTSAAIVQAEWEIHGHRAPAYFTISLLICVIIPISIYVTLKDMIDDWIGVKYYFAFIVYHVAALFSLGWLAYTIYVQIRYGNNLLPVIALLVCSSVLVLPMSADLWMLVIKPRLFSTYTSVQLFACLWLFVSRPTNCSRHCFDMRLLDVYFGDEL